VFHVYQEAAQETFEQPPHTAITDDLCDVAFCEEYNAFQLSDFDAELVPSCKYMLVFKMKLLLGFTDI
jgi:hypothetical protein